MATFRVTQNMMVDRSLESLQLGLGRLARVQEQLSTGRVLNRPSDSPTDTTSAMRIRASVAAVEQYTRNAQDGMGRLGLVDQTLMGVSTTVRQARNLALQGASSGSLSQASREALATEVDQLRDALLDDANTTYLTVPVFGGVTAGKHAYDDAGNFIGVEAEVTRRVADTVRIRVDVSGVAVFGDGDASVFAELDSLSAALRSDDSAGIQTSLTVLGDRLTAIATVHANVGTSYSRIERAASALEDERVGLTTALSEIENVDLPRAMVELNLQEVAYQAALASTARVTQPSLLDFLR